VNRRRRGPDDPRPLLALLACIAGYPTLRFLSRLEPGRLSDLALRTSTLAIALGATVIATALARHRQLSTGRTLISRRALAVVPADEFDAAPELVGAFAAQLARSGRRIGGFWDRRASALRVRILNDDEGRLVYLLDVPERDLPTLRAALRGYRGVELRDPAEVLPAEDDVADEAVLRTELVLAQPVVEPLARLPLDPDPLSPFVAAVAGLDARRGEHAEVCLDLLPIGGFRVLWRRWWMRRQATRRGAKVERDGGGFGGEGQGRRDPGEQAERRDLNRGLDVKLRGGAPLFEAQVLLSARAPGRPRAEGIMRGLVAAFGPFSDRNWFRASGVHLAGLAFLGSDLPTRRRGFDRRLRTGLFRPARRSVVTTVEVAGFLKPPTVNCGPENALRSGALLAASPDLPGFTPDRGDLIPVGKVSGERGDRIVGVRTEDTFFTYVAGRSRWGKTEAAITMFTHLVRSGQGGLFLDPHGDALDRIRPYLGEPGVAERVVEIDLGPGGGEDQPCWNLFELRGVDAEDRVEAVVDAFSTAMGWGEKSTRAINLITQTATALASISQALPPELAPTVFQIPTLLTDAAWREAVLPFLPGSAQSFWRERFPRLSEEAVTPLTNLVDRLGASRKTVALLGASRSTLSLREAMDRGLIVLFCPGHGGTRERLIANLAAFDVFYSGRSRGELDAGDRRLFWLALDEAQTYDSDTLAAIEEQGAKFGLRAIVMNQNPERLRPATLNSLTTNRSHMMVSALNARAASLVTKEWAGEPRPEAITRLPRYHFVAQVTHRGELSRPFALRGVRVEDALGPPPPGGLDRLSAAMECSGRRRRGADVLAEAATLDERIVSGLKSRRRGEARRRPAKRVRGERHQPSPARPFEAEVESP
jgi:hypothetical protein